MGCASTFAIASSYLPHRKESHSQSRNKKAFQYDVYYLLRNCTCFRFSDDHQMSLAGVPRPDVWGGVPYLTFPGGGGALPSDLSRTDRRL